MITVLTGTNTFLLRAAYNKLVEAFVLGHGELALEKFDGAEVTKETLLGALQSLPFLATKKMVVVQELSKNKGITDSIDDIIISVPDSTDFVIIEDKLDKRGVYYKTLKKQPGFQEFEELDEIALAAWVAEEVQEQGGTINPSDVRYLVGRVGPNQQLLGSELAKLVLYSPQITRNTITDMVEPHPRSTVFELLDTAFAGNVTRMLELYDEQRALKVEPQAILAMITWQLHIIALIKVAGSSRRAADIAREGHVSPYVVNKSMTIAKRMTTQAVRKLVHDTLLLDARIKTEPIDPDAALVDLLVSISSGSFLAIS